MTVEVTDGRGAAHEDVRRDIEDVARGGSDPRAANGGASSRPSNGATDATGTASVADRPGFLRRYRLPLALGFVALCLYAGSILYILYGRGQIA